MLKKVWFMFVLWSVLMVSGCSGKQTEDVESKVVSEKEISEMDVTEDLEADVSLEAEIDVIGNSDASMETEQIQTSDVDEQSSDCSNVEASTKEEPTVDDITKETDVEPSSTAAQSEPEAATIQRFISKLDSIGVIYRYSDDMLDEFMRLESVVAQMKRETEKEQGKKIESKSRSL